MLYLCKERHHAYLIVFISLTYDFEMEKNKHIRETNIHTIMQNKTNINLTQYNFVCKSDISEKQYECC